MSKYTTGVVGVCLLKLIHKVMCAAVVIGKECPLEDLVVASWRMWPDSFGLDGYPQYPHALSVHSKVYGDAGLVNMGWLNIVHGVISVTDKGKKELNKVLKTAASPMVLRTHLAKSERRKIDDCSSKKEGSGEYSYEEE